jgi:vancomycin aglycone glucosyltransferase
MTHAESAKAGGFALHVLVTTMGSRGDVQPLLGLAVGLRSRGHTVTVAAPPSYRSWIADELGFPFHPIGFDIFEWAQRQTDVAQSPLKAMRIMTGVLRAEVAAQFRDMKGIMDGVDHVVAGGLQVAAASYAELTGAGYTYVAFIPNLMRSSNHVPGLVSWPTLPAPLRQVSWWVFDGVYQRVLGPGVNRERQAVGLPPARRFGPLFIGPEPLLAYDPVLSETPRDTEVPFVETGVFTLRSPEALPEELDRFLSAGPPPYYLGFGSVPDVSPAETTRRFVAAVQAVGGRGIVSRGWAKLASDTLPEGFLAIGSVPHEKLFPRVAAVIHHGGAGTTHTAARAGVPQWVVPHGADQFYWAHRVQVLGLGPPGIAKTKFSEGRIAAGLTELKQNPSFKLRAEELGKALREIDGVGNAVRFLEEKFHARQRRSA